MGRPLPLAERPKRRPRRETQRRMSLATSKLRGPLPLSRLREGGGSSRRSGGSSSSDAVDHKASRATPLCNPWRVAAEAGITLMLASWALTTATVYYYSRLRCATPGASQYITISRGDDAIVAIESTSPAVAYGMVWMVDRDGHVVLGQVQAPPPPPPPSALQSPPQPQPEPPATQIPPHAFHAEWHGEYFCLRWLVDMRLVEVVADGPERFVLRANRRRCDRPAQHFEYHKYSLWNRGAQSYVNVRNTRLLRAHGDAAPWKPLHRETRYTRMGLLPFPDAMQSVFMRQLIDALSRREGDAGGARAAFSPHTPDAGGGAAAAPAP